MPALKPNQSYDITLKIKDEDFSAELFSVQIISTLRSYYPIIQLTLIADVDDIILKKIYGQDTIKLDINLLDETINQQQVIYSFELVHVSDNFPLQMTNRISQSGIAEGISSEVANNKVTVTTICKKSMITMTTPINKVFSNTNIKNIIESVASEVNCDLKLDENKINNVTIDQVCIPPSTIINTLSYLDEYFGIHDGITSVYCTHKNELQIFNLTEKIKESPVFTVTQLAIDSDNKKITEELYDDKHFYTLSSIDKTYKGNTKFSIHSKHMKHIIKPKNNLSYTIRTDLEEMVQKYGIIDYKDSSSKPNLFLDKEILKNRSHYYIDKTGQEYSDIFIHANKAKPFANLSTLQMSIVRSLHINNLIRVGEPVKFDSKILEYAPFTGMYILFSSVLVFNRYTKDWASAAFITLGRSNKSILN